MPDGMDLKDRRPTARLSEIDRRILRLVAQGRSSKEIGQELHRSPLTIDSRLKEVCARLGADNRVQAATMLLVDEATDPPPRFRGPPIMEGCHRRSVAACCRRGWRQFRFGAAGLGPCHRQRCRFESGRNRKGGPA